MVKWLGIGKQVGSDNLSTPLLPSGSDDYDPAAAATTEGSPRSSPLEQQQQHEVTAAAVNAYAKSITRRRSSTLGATKRRRRRLSRIKSHASSISRRVSTVSVASSEVTHRIDHLSSHETTTTTTTTSRRSYGRTDSELSDYSTTNVDIEKDVPREKLTAEATAKVGAVILITAAGIALFVAAFVYSVTMPLISAVATVTVGVAGGWSILVSTPLVWIGEWRLTHLPALRNKVNQLRQMVERFQCQVEILRMIEVDLREDIKTLQQSSDELESAVKKIGGNVNEFVTLVHENQVILLQMKENMRQAVLQEVVRLVLQSDIDRDGVINKKEANILAKRLSFSLEIYGIVFDELKFHCAVGLSPSIAGVMTIVKRLLPDENDRPSSFYSSESSDSDYDSEEDKERDDIYDMFYVPVDGRLDQGDADTIYLCKEYLAEKGEQPTLISVAPTLGKRVKGLRCSVSCDE